MYVQNLQKETLKNLEDNASNTIKEKDLKKDLFNVNKFQKRLVSYKRTSKNNIQMKENKKEDSKIIQLVKQYNE